MEGGTDEGLGWGSGEREGKKGTPVTTLLAKGSVNLVLDRCED